MKLETRLNLRDSVFFIHEGTIYNGMVTDISLKEGLHTNSNMEWCRSNSSFSITVNYNLGTSATGEKNRKTFSNESKLFETKMEAGRELLRQNGLDVSLMEVN